MSDSKKRELCSVAHVAMSRVHSSITMAEASQLVDACVVITPPGEEVVIIKYLRIGAGGRDGGSSAKPGNVLLNLRKLVVAAASGVLTLSGGVLAPWLYVVGGLVIWDSLYSCLQIEVDETTAAVIWTLWKYADGENTIAKDGLLARVNAELKRHQGRAVSQEQLQQSLQKLERMSTIATSRTDLTRWWLREWVRVRYS